MCVSLPTREERLPNATLFCNQQNARLVHIDSQEKQQFIETFIVSSGTMITNNIIIQFTFSKNIPMKYCGIYFHMIIIMYVCELKQRYVLASRLPDPCGLTVVYKIPHH